MGVSCCLRGVSRKDTCNDHVQSEGICSVKPSQRPNGVALTVAVFCAHFLTCGVSYSIGAFYVTFLEVFDETNGVTSWIGSLNLGTLCATGPLASYMIDKLGVRPTVMIGGLLAATGIGFGALSPNIFVLFICFGIISGLGYGMVFTSGVVVVGISVKKHRTLAMGISISGIGLGNFVYPFLASYLIDFYGWRGALLITSGLTLNTCVFGMLMNVSSSNLDIEVEVVDEGQVEKVYDLSEKPLMNPALMRLQSSSHEFLPLSKNSSLKLNPSRGLTNSVQSLHLNNYLKPHMDLSKSKSSDVLSNAKLSTSLSSSSGFLKPKIHLSSMHILGSMGRLAPTEVIYLSKKSLNQDLGSQNVNSPVKPSVPSEQYSQTSNDLSESALIKHKQKESSFEFDDGNTKNKLYAFTLFHYWLLHANILMFCFSLSVALTHIFAYSQYQGASVKQATLLISLNGVANVVGRCGLGALTQHPKVNTFILYIICYGISGIATFVLTVWTSFVGMMVSVILFGLFSAAFGPVLSEAAIEILGVEHFNYGYGFLMISMAIGTTLGAPTAGWLYDVTQDYTSSFYLGGAFLICSALMMVPPAVCDKSCQLKKKPQPLQIEITVTEKEEV